MRKPFNRYSIIRDKLRWARLCFCYVGLCEDNLNYRMDLDEIWYIILGRN